MIITLNDHNYFLHLALKGVIMSRIAINCELIAKSKQRYVSWIVCAFFYVKDILQNILMGYSIKRYRENDWVSEWVIEEAQILSLKMAVQMAGVLQKKMGKDVCMFDGSVSSNDIDRER